MEKVFLSLGSNLGDRRLNLKKALDLLPLENKMTSSIYETEPLMNKEQPWFFNTVVCGQTGLSSEDLLNALEKIETQLGRNKTADRYQPRPIDIDIIFYGNRVMKTGRLTIPHPEMAKRQFVLIPLAEIAPKFIHPVFKKTVWKLLKDCPDTSIVREPSAL